MKSAWFGVLVIGSILVGGAAEAQEMCRYREYVLGSSLESVTRVSGALASDARTLHERPAMLQRLLWRAPYLKSLARSADPVRDVAFSFYDGALYQVIVNYDRTRTEGLTSADLVEAVSSEYGPGVLAGLSSRRNLPGESSPGSVVVARWQNAEMLLTLLQSEGAPEFQLILISKSLGAQAQRALREAARLDLVEGPRREQENREKASRDAAVAREKARDTNKAAFRP